MRQRNRCERGAAAVEFALVVMVFLTMVMGVIEFGRAWAIQANLAQAAREAAREMAVKDDETLAAQHFYESFVPFGESTAEAAGATVDFSRTGTAGDEGCRDTAEATYTTDTLTGFFVPQITLTGKGTMRCGG